MFQFVFPTKEDSLKVLNGRSWPFDGQYLILKDWSEESEAKPETLRFVQIWVQVWDLPSHWMSKAVGLKIGELFNGAKDVIVPENRSKKGRHLKLLVEADVYKPLLRGTKIKLNNQTRWVTFKYEQIQNFCFYCGKMGHGEKICEQRNGDVKRGSLKEGQFGEWLKADIVKRQAGIKEWK